LFLTLCRHPRQFSDLSGQRFKYLFYLFKMRHKKLESTRANAGIFAQGDQRYFLICQFYD
jgi:hypothetical protein